MRLSPVLENIRVFHDGDVEEVCEEVSGESWSSCRPPVSRLPAVFQPPVSRLSAVCPAACLPPVSRLSAACPAACQAACQPPVSRLSAACQPS
ncbi:hypothetical protein KUCAC02_034972, partial [Chaenocephalus aceratus]